MNPQFDQDTLQKIKQATAAGYDQNTVMQKAMQYQAQKTQMQQPQQPQEDSGGGSMLTNLLPLLGGIGGSALGSLAAPGLGTIAGGGIGAGLGQTLADILSHKTPTITDVGGQAAAGTIGGVAGKALEPVFGLAGKALSRFGPQALDKAGTGFIASQYNVPRSLARSANLNDTISQLSKYGISNINDVIPAAEQVTGVDGIISKLTNSAVAKAPPVNTVGIRRMAQDLISTNPTTGDDKVINFIDKQITSMNGGAKGTVEVNAHPSDVLQVIRNLEGKAAEINKVPPQARTQEALSTAKIYNSVADELKDRLYLGMDHTGEMLDHGGADQIVLKNPLTPDSPEYQALAKISPVLANEVANAKSIGDMRSLAAPFVRGSRLANETEAGSQIGFNNVGGAVKGIAKGMPTLANPLAPVQQLLGTDTVNAAAGQGIKNVAGVMGKIPLPSSALLAKITGQAVGQGVTTTPPSPEQANAAEIAPSATSSLTSATTSPETPQIDPVKALLGSIMLSHAKNANDLIAAYTFLNPNGKESETARVDKQKAQGILNLIQDMQGNVMQAKHIGPFGSLLQKAEEKTGVAGGGDPATIQLNQNMALLKQLIATEVHRRGMSEVSLKTMYDAFPQNGDSHATYVQKLNHLQDMMQMYFPSQ